MGRFLIWLSGAPRQTLDEGPTERSTYVGIGASILITASMAAVSLTFALVTALNVESWLAIPFAIAWGLAILSLDRLFMVSLSRKYTLRAQLLRAAPRVLLALLLGFVISTPFVLQIFRPEIEHEITILHTQAENVFLAEVRNSQLQQEITRDQKQVNALTAEASGGEPPAQNSQLQNTLNQLNQAKSAEANDYKQLQCQLYGGSAGGLPCQATGNGPLARADQQRYENDVAQVNQLTDTVSSEQAKNKVKAEAQLPAAQKVLQAAQKEEAQAESTFTTQNEKNWGLLIRLRALAVLTSYDSTLNAARWLLYLFFVLIFCMPVIIKVMLNLGPENNAREEQIARQRLRSAEDDLANALSGLKPTSQKSIDGKKPNEPNGRGSPNEAAELTDDGSALTDALLSLAPSQLTAREDRLALSALWELTHSRLDLYHHIATGQARRSFLTAQGAIISGFALLIGFAILSVRAHSTAASITIAGLGAVSAALAGYIGRTFVRSQESAAAHLRAYFDQPLEFSRFLAVERLLSAQKELSNDQRISLLVTVVNAMVSPAAPISSDKQVGRRQRHSEPSSSRG